MQKSLITLVCKYFIYFLYIYFNYFINTLAIKYNDNYDDNEYINKLNWFNLKKFNSLRTIYIPMEHLGTKNIF